MKKLFLIRHAKSSWSDPSITDFYRTLNKRGKRDAPFMAAKVAASGAKPDLIVSSPAKRAKKTAKYMAEGVGYDSSNIKYYDAIYSSSRMELYQVLKMIDDRCNELFFVGHNYAITDLAEEITGQQLVNIPTSGIVSIACTIKKWKDIAPGCGTLVFFDFPKRYRE